MGRGKPGEGGGGRGRRGGYSVSCMTVVSKDRRPSYPERTETEHVRFSSTRQTALVFKRRRGGGVSIWFFIPAVVLFRSSRWRLPRLIYSNSIRPRFNQIVVFFCLLLRAVCGLFRVSRGLILRLNSFYPRFSACMFGFSVCPRRRCATRWTTWRRTGFPSR